MPQGKAYCFEIAGTFRLCGFLRSNDGFNYTSDYIGNDNVAVAVFQIKAFNQASLWKSVRKAK